MENHSQRDRIVSVLIFIVIFLAITSYMRGDWKIRFPSSVTRLFVNPDVDMHEESAPETLDFMRNLQGRIKRNWYPPTKAKKSNTVKVLFEVDKSGSVKSQKVSLSSNDPDYDKAALDAVKSTKLPPLPDNLPDAVDIEMSFDYNVFIEKKAKP